MRTIGYLRIASLALVIFICLLAASNCGGGNGKSLGMLPLGGSNPAVEIPLDKALAEIEALETPAGVSSALFQEIKGELTRQLRAKGVSKFASKPPTGEANAVTGLAFAPDGAGWVLTWRYRCVGDYNQDGIANIADITPLAINFLQPAPDPNSIQGVVDGNVDEIINVADVTPLAMNFLTDCAGYRVQGADDIGGPWTTDAEIVIEEAEASGRLLFSVPYTALTYAYYRVVPVDGAGVEGIESNIAGAPPVIAAVTPAEGVVGADVTFSAVVAGAPPFAYAWDFGGGAAPNTSAEQAPVVTLGAAGSYGASLTVTSDFGADTYDFTLTVTATPMPPVIITVSPAEGLAGSDVTFTATVTGTPPFAYAWNFGGGAAPNTSAEEAPVVTLGAAGSYGASLTVTSDFGADTYDFTLTVIPREWVHTWGGGEWDDAQALCVDGGGNVYVAGLTYSFGAGENDAFLLKYGAGGDLLWEKTWGGGEWDYAYALCVDSGGNVYVAGYTESFGAGENDAFLLKYGAGGELLWEKTWRGSSDDYANALCVDGGGNVYVAGYTYSFGAGDYDAFLLKYGAGGELLWEKTWGGGSVEVAYALGVDGGGKVYVAGGTSSFSAGYDDAFLLKYGAGGDLLWEKTWGGSSFDYANALCVDSGGNVYVSGRAYSFGAGNGDAFLIKYGAGGELLWEKTWGGGDRDYAEALGVDGGGNVYVAGGTYSFGAGSYDAFLLKYGAGGELLWEKTWGGGDRDYAYALGVDGEGMIYLGGAAPNIYGSWDTPDGVSGDAAGAVGSPTGSESSPSGTQGAPAGTETEPDGVEDTGGGNQDALVVKIDPSAW